MAPGFLTAGFLENEFQRAQCKPQMVNCKRGVIEIKPPNEDAWAIASGEQVSRYWGKYGLVLVTNYRDFVLIGKDSQGRSEKLETYRLSNNETDFWAMVAHPQSAATEHFTALSNI